MDDDEENYFDKRETLKPYGTIDSKDIILFNQDEDNKEDIDNKEDNNIKEDQILEQIKEENEKDIEYKQNTDNNGNSLMPSFTQEIKDKEKSIDDEIKKEGNNDMIMKGGLENLTAVERKKRVALLKIQETLHLPTSQSPNHRLSKTLLDGLPRVNSMPISCMRGLCNKDSDNISVPDNSTERSSILDDDRKSISRSISSPLLTRPKAKSIKRFEKSTTSESRTFHRAESNIAKILSTTSAPGTASQAMLRALSVTDHKPCLLKKNSPTSSTRPYGIHDEGKIDKSTISRTENSVLKRTRNSENPRRSKPNSVQETKDEVVSPPLSPRICIKRLSEQAKESEEIEKILNPEEESKIIEAVSIQNKVGSLMGWGITEQLIKFADIYLSLDSNGQKKMRWEMDSNGVNKNYNQICFLYVMGLLEDQQPELFEKFMIAMEKNQDPESMKPVPFSEKKQYFAVLTDIDDTLMPAHDTFNFGGCDESWRKDGTLYPGLSELHRVLRGENAPYNQPGSRGYSVCLTARPVSLALNMRKKFARLGQKLSIMSGSFYDNVTRDVKSRYINYAKNKILKFKSYMRFFPNEMFVFFGDNGQGDILAAEQMLRYNVVAFCCIHMVEYYSDEGDVVTALALDAPDSSVVLDAMKNGRLFFYWNVDHLVKELSTHGWITEEEAQRVSAAFVRDEVCEEATWCVRYQDQRGLDDIQLIRTQDGERAMDCWERRQVLISKMMYDSVAAHQAVSILVDPLMCIRGMSILITIESLTVYSKRSNKNEKKSGFSGFMSSVSKIAKAAVHPTYRVCLKLCSGSDEIYNIGEAVGKPQGEDFYTFSGLDGGKCVFIVKPDLIRKSDRMAVNVMTEALGGYMESRHSSMSVPIEETLDATPAHKFPCSFTWELYRANQLSDELGKICIFCSKEDDDASPATTEVCSACNDVRKEITPEAIESSNFKRAELIVNMNWCPSDHKCIQGNGNRSFWE